MLWYEGCPQWNILNVSVASLNCTGYCNGSQCSLNNNEEARWLPRRTTRLVHFKLSGAFWCLLARCSKVCYWYSRAGNWLTPIDGFSGVIHQVAEISEVEILHLAEETCSLKLRLDSCMMLRSLTWSDNVTPATSTLAMLMRIKSKESWDRIEGSNVWVWARERERERERESDEELTVISILLLGRFVECRYERYWGNKYNESGQARNHRTFILAQLQIILFSQLMSWTSH